MAEPFIGSAAVARGTLTRHELRTRFVAIHRDIYVAKDSDLTALTRAKACWLRTRGHGILAGFSASAVHGAKWIDAKVPATAIHTNRRPLPGIVVWAAAITDDEVCIVDGMRVTTPARTAVDLARRYPVDTAVVAIDSLARATRITVADIESSVRKHPGRQGLKRALEVLSLVDPGAESPRETWLRLIVVRAGYPQPETQLSVYNEYGALIGVVDLGWSDIKIALEYEGKHHRMSRGVSTETSGAPTSYWSRAGSSFASPRWTLRLRSSAGSRRPGPDAHGSAVDDPETDHPRDRRQ